MNFRTWKMVRKYRELPMQKKLTISFSFPVIIICIVITLISAPILSNAYEKQLQYSVNQSCVQASNFILNRIENMYYIAKLMEGSREITGVLESESFGKYNDLAEAYREFYTLNSAFRDIELANSNYKIGIYIPDHLIYSSNNYYFFPQSSIEARKDYDEIMEAVEQEKVYFTIQEEAQSANPSLTEKYIAMFYSVKVEREGKPQTYITKVEISLKDIKEILLNVISTKDNLVYLVDERGNLLTTSKESEYEELKNELPMEKVNSWMKTKINATTYYVVNQKIEGYNWQLYSVFPIADFNRQMRFVSIMMLTIMCLLAIAVVIISYFLSRSYVRRLTTLNQNMKHLEEGKLNTQVQLVHSDLSKGDEIDEIYENFNDMAEKLQQLMKSHYKLGKSVMSAELRALQAQINPHFLYNTLDLINWGALDFGATDVACMARNLGQFYRLSLNHGRSAICIEDELKHVEAYVNIEKMHFPGALHLVIDVPEEIKKYACLNIILQPFVENSIIHGIAEHPDIIECTITIEATMEGDTIIFTIQDDGPGIAEEFLNGNFIETSSNENNGYGVKNINFRIKLCYGDKYGVSYDNTIDQGTRVIIKIPAMSFQDLDESLK